MQSLASVIFGRNRSITWVTLSQKISVCRSKKIEVIMIWPTPKNVIVVRSFTSIARYYWKFLRNYLNLLTQ